MKKSIPLAVLLLALLYIADAVAPKWEWECKSTTAPGGLFPLNAGHIPGLGDPDTRAVKPERPAGCELHARNLLRRAFDWWIE